MAARIQDFVGVQYLREGTAWEQQAWSNYNYQYATSSHGIDHDMNPALIVQPKSEEDIVIALKHAIAQGISVSVKSGGHQYSGACSTSGENIMIDLKPTFRDPDKDLKVIEQANGKTWVYASVSWALLEFNGFLAKHGLFIPHGQCSDVRLGGHTQTGGYATVRDIDASSDPELFNSILGGSPGNFGIITHYTYEVHRDKDHEFGDVKPKGLKAMFWYSRKTLTALLTKLAEMSDSGDFPRNYDLSVSVLSSDFPVLDLYGNGIDEVMKRDHRDIFGMDGLPGWPKSIILFAQFVPFSKDDKYDPKWFDGLLECTSWLSRIHHSYLDLPMSKMTREWVFGNVREFDHPYVKRTYCTSSTTLVKDGWPQMISDRLEKVMMPSTKDIYLNCWVSCQVYVFGGKHAMFTSREDGSKYDTSYSWRDSSIGCTIDLFHESAVQPVAEAWQAGNDEAFNGPEGKFSKGHEKRVLWGSYGNWDLHDQWRFYYEDQEKYDRLRKARANADPNGTFTANPFAVKRWDT